jgi:hypothetical protein
MNLRGIERGAYKQFETGLEFIISKKNQIFAYPLLHLQKKMNLFILSILAVLVHLVQSGIESNSADEQMDLQFLIDELKEKDPLYVEHFIEKCKTKEELKEELLKMYKHEGPTFWPLDLELEKDKYDPKIRRLLQRAKEQNEWIMKLWFNQDDFKMKLSQIALDAAKSTFGILSHLAQKEFDEKVRANEYPYEYTDHKSGGMRLNEPWDLYILNAKNELTGNRIVFSFKEGKFVRISPHGKKVWNF